MAPKREDKTVVRHIRQELTLAPIRQFCPLLLCGVLLNAITQIENHLVDLRIEQISL